MVAGAGAAGGAPPPFATAVAVDEDRYPSDFHGAPKAGKAFADKVRATSRWQTLPHAWSSRHFVRAAQSATQMQ